MKALEIRRVGDRGEFRFALKGVVDARGARMLDRVLLECQGRGAAAVHLDFGEVSGISAPATAMLGRWGRVYEETGRRVYALGLSAGIRAALAEAGAIVYEPNEAAVPPLPVPPPPPPEAGGEPPPVAADDEPVPDRASLQTRLRRKIVEFRNLFEITRGLNLALDLDEVLSLFGLSVMGQFGLERLAVFVVESGRDGNLTPRHARGFAPEHFLDFVIPVDVARRCEPDHPVRPLSDWAEGPEPWEGIEALRQSGLEWAVGLWVRRDLEGVLLIGGRGSGREFEEDERDLLTILAHQAAVAIANARFHKAQEERNLGLVRGMMALIESRDTYAKGSTERVVRYVSAVARVLEIPRESLRMLIYGAVLRDIGMLTVSGLLLKNPAHLSEEEWSLIKQHPIRGAQILEEMDLPREVIDVVLHHHERWGGEGYPAGIRGKDIPLGARIVSLIDAYVAMTGERPYRRALPYEKARQVIEENWGTPFDPQIVEVFLGVLDSAERRTRLRAGPKPPGPGGAREAETGVGAPARLDPLGAGVSIPTESRP